MTLTYANMPLDRCSNQRKNKRWLTAEFHHEDSLFCLINEGKSFFKQCDKLSPFYLTKQQLEALTVENCVYLGKEVLNKGVLGKASSGSIFAVDFNKLRYSTQEALSNEGQWHSLRQVTPILSGFNAAILALAKGLVHWHNTHRYCGLCGHPNRSIESGHARKCTECRNLTFPRTDPAVIMLVERMFDDGVARCLLGRQENWPKDVYSTLAGFVDPGESLEEAVIREVAEESGIVAENPQYVASQPWPFPASIMLGFTAVATSEKIDVSQDSLEIAQWFSREQLISFEENNAMLAVQDSDKPIDNKLNQNNRNKDTVTSPKQNYKISSSDSISSYLINAWKNKQIGIY
jgi:NAD+ diphosphatase